MRLPRMTWDRRHNVASIEVSFSKRIWHRTEIEDAFILGYNATGRLSRIVVLDPARVLPAGSSEHAALEAIRDRLNGRTRAEDLTVLQSAIDRARLKR